MGALRFIGLVSGGSAGRKEFATGQTLIARAVYLDNRLFTRAAKYCDGLYEDWYIVSTLHGLVAPNAQITPYDRDLRYISAEERKAWRERMFIELDKAGLFEPDIRIWWHTTLPYSDLLTGLWPAKQQYFPLSTLGLGEQMAWYSQHGY